MWIKVVKLELIPHIDYVGTMNLELLFAITTKEQSKLALTKRRDKVSPELSSLPREEEETEEPDNDAVDRLVSELSVDRPGLREVGRFGCPHRSCAQTEQHSSRHQGVEPEQIKEIYMYILFNI